MFLSQLRGNKADRLVVNGVEVLLQRCRHAFLAGEGARERLQLDRPELDEIRSDSPAVQLLLPQRFVALRGRDQPLLNQDVPKSTAQGLPL